MGLKLQADLSIADLRDCGWIFKCRLQSGNLLVASIREPQGQMTRSNDQCRSNRSNNLSRRMNRGVGGTCRAEDIEGGSSALGNEDSAIIVFALLFHRRKSGARHLYDFFLADIPHETIYDLGGSGYLHNTHFVVLTD